MSRSKCFDGIATRAHSTIEALLRLYVQKTPHGGGASFEGWDLVVERTELSEAGDDGGHRFDDAVDLGFGGVSRERETDGSVRKREGDAHGTEYMRGIQAA